MIYGCSVLNIVFTKLCSYNNCTVVFSEFFSNELLLMSCVCDSAGARGHAHGAHDGGRVHRAAAGQHGGGVGGARGRRARARARLRAAAAHAAQVLHLPVAHRQREYFCLS